MARLDDFSLIPGEEAYPLPTEDCALVPDHARGYDDECAFCAGVQAWEQL